MNFDNIYFSVMAFMIVVGLFLSYGSFYNKILDTEIITNGTEYMMIHIFLVFALNNISISLEFMHNSSVNVLPKISFLVVSFILFFLCMFFTIKFAKQKCKINKRLVIVTALFSVSFIFLMMMLRNQMYVNIALIVLFVFGFFLIIYNQGIAENNPKCKKLLFK